jgi:hypothetical protein
MTYYKYAERDATSQVNWADVSKKWTDQINQVSTDRDKKRADIQKATDELTDSIINAPMGENEGVNAWYSNFADQSSEYLLDANRRLKSGDLKVRDYNTIMANMTQGTERMTGLAKDYSDNYTVKMERLKNDQSQQAEVAMMELAEGYANFTNTQGIVNPTNGMISIAKNDTGETITIPQMRAYINMQYDKYDVGAALDEQVARLAADKKVIMSGDVKTRESQLRAWNLAKDNLLDAELADGLHVSSLLTEDVGGYNVVTDATKVGENDVLFVLDPRQPSAGYRVPLYGLDLSNRTEADLDMIFSADLDDTQRSALIKQAEEQKGVARDWLNTDFERRLGVIETPMKEPTDGGDTGLSATERGKYAETQSGLESLAKVFYGDKKLRQEGLDEVFGQDETITSYGVREAADGQQEIFVQQMRDDGTVVERTPIPLGEAFTQFAKPAGTQFFDAAYIDDVLPGILKKYEGRQRGSGEYTTTRQPILTDISNVEIDYRGDKMTIKKALDKAGGVSRFGRAFGTRTDAEEEVQVIRTVLGAPEVGINATVASVDERTIEKARGESASEGTITAPGVQVFVDGRMDKPVIIPNTPSSMDALMSVVDMLAKNRFVTADELLALLPEEAKAYNTPEVISSIFTEEVTEEAPNYDWSKAGQ